MPRLATLVAGLSAVACVCNKQQLVKDYRHSTNTVIAQQEQLIYCSIPVAVTNCPPF